MNNVPKLGRYLLAIPMIVYAPLHFVYPQFVAAIVPPWIPFPLFWTYFTAVAIFAAGVAILFRRYAYIASVLLGIEILLFCILIHGQLLFHITMYPKYIQDLFGDMPNRLINSFKDLGLCGAAFIFAGVESKTWKVNRANELFTLGRFILGLSIVAFGILHFIYPMFAPGIPPMLSSVPFVIPGQASWVYLTSILLFVGGLLILTGEKSRALITWLGVILLLFDLLVWVPQFGKNIGDLYGNWLKDIGVIGGIFILADTIPSKPKPLKV